MQFELDMPARVAAGGGSIENLPAEAAALGVAGVLLVCDPFAADSGLADRAVDILKAARIEASLFTGVTAEPDTTMVESALRQFAADGCDGVIAIGGGSVIDTAKTAAVMAANDLPAKGLMGLDNVPQRGVPMIAAPTTSGTGSEATKVVVIADPTDCVKMTGRSRYFMPDVALLDWKLTATMDADLTATVGIDALTHAVEAYTSRLANCFTDTMALTAARRIWTSIEAACTDGDDAWAREQMLIGSFEAGLAFSNSSVGLVHSMSEPLGACFHVPHGLSNAMLLPAVTRFSARSTPGRYASLARHLGLADQSVPDSQAAETLAEALKQLNRTLGIPTPQQFGIDRNHYDAQIEKMTADAASAGSTANSAAPATADEIKNIYRSAC